MITNEPIPYFFRSEKTEIAFFKMSRSSRRSAFSRCNRRNSICSALRKRTNLNLTAVKIYVRRCIYYWMHLFL
ncbi:MAG: hypothetical protein DRP46_10040, partial [Candidatus Zixiibacteriota bacterium]